MKYLLTGEESDRLLFKEVSLDYYGEWLRFFEDPETTRYWTSPDIPPRDACDKWFAKQARRYDQDLGGMNALIEKDTGNFIGHCGLLVQVVDEVTELEIAYSIMPDFWKLGYATEAAKKCMNFGFENKYTDSLISIISITNIPSERVARKNGLKISKRTTYNLNEVNIFRITEKEWRKVNE